VLDEFIAGLRRHEVFHLVTVANAEGAELYFRLRDEPDFTVIEACREGEAVAIATGLYLGGERPLLSVENFGLYEALDTFRGLPMDIGIPLPLLVGHTGMPEDGVEEAYDGMYGNIASQALLGGTWTKPILDAIGVPSTYLAPSSPPDAVARAMDETFASPTPSALLIKGFSA
jgi:sulfopyruvate decarboxylase TPP-binding subunit